MSWTAKAAAVAVVALASLGINDTVPGDVALLLLLLALAVAWRSVRGFWRIVVSGLVGGAVAGLLILGPGFRLAMRAVAIMDPGHPQEFTVGGTLFIIVGVGAILGGVTAATAHLFRRAFAIESAVTAGALLAAVEMTKLTFLSGEVSDELFQLGISPWINIPLFGLITLGYGIGAMAIADKAESAMFSSKSKEREKVPA